MKTAELTKGLLKHLTDVEQALDHLQYGADLKEVCDALILALFRCQGLVAIFVREEEADGQG